MITHFKPSAGSWLAAGSASRQPQSPTSTLCPRKVGNRPLQTPISPPFRSTPPQRTNHDHQQHASSRKRKRPGDSLASIARRKASRQPQPPTLPLPPRKVGDPGPPEPD